MSGPLALKYGLAVIANLLSITAAPLNPDPHKKIFRG
jgi:hypothetical protein